MSDRGRTNGPLRVCPDNPRYLCDASGRALYLTGSHTWADLQDYLSPDPDQTFDFAAYLDWLVAHDFNFLRGWAWEQASYGYCSPEKVLVHPVPYLRTGPGLALDGEPRFDLTRLNPEYFARLRERAQACAERGIYLSVMFFQGFSLYDCGLGQGGNPWRGHPFHVANNVNGLDVNPQNPDDGRITHTLRLPEVTRLQEQYVERVVTELAALDNVLYEIANESWGGSIEWQYHLIDFVHQTERRLGVRHPVGMTIPWEGVETPASNEVLFDSPAEWISPGYPGGIYRSDPPPADGRKVVIADTDHLWGLGGTLNWIWKSFCRGLNPILMDPYEAQYGLSDFPLEGILHNRYHPLWEPLRRNLGYTRRYAERMNLNRCVPHGELTNTEYCLADPGQEYLVFLPDGVRARLDLCEAPGSFAVEWFDPMTGVLVEAAPVEGGEARWFVSPFAYQAALFLKRIN